MIVGLAYGAWGAGTLAGVAWAASKWRAYFRSLTPPSAYEVHRERFIETGEWTELDSALQSLN